MTETVTSVQSEVCKLSSDEDVSEALAYALTHMPWIFYEDGEDMIKARIFIKCDHWLVEEEFAFLSHVHMLTEAWRQLLGLEVQVAESKLREKQTTFHLTDEEKSSLVKYIYLHNGEDVERRMGEVLVFFQKWMEAQEDFVTDRLQKQLYNRFRPLQYVKRVLAPCSFGRKVASDEDVERFTSETDE